MDAVSHIVVGMGVQITCAQNSDIGQEIVGFVFGLYYGSRFSGFCRKVAVERI